jgi:hypothetical protein
LKSHTLLTIIALASLIGLVGCGKSGDGKPGARPPGTVDLTVLQQAFPAPTPELQQNLDRVRYAVRYRQLDAALVELDKVSRLPNLTDAQKKAVNDVIQQVKAAIAAVPAPPAQ